MASTDPGPRDHLITRALERDLAEVAAEALDESPLDAAEAPDRLARHAMDELRRELRVEGAAADVQARTVNEILRTFAPGAGSDAEVALPARVLQGIRGRSPLGDVVPLPPLPATPFSQSDLLVNAEGQPNVGSELRAELATADSVDLICAFVIWSGVRHLREALAERSLSRGGRVRVITTTYMGATEKRAVDELVALGADVRVAFDARTTKLHAKAWLLERASGLSTAFVGSSNLSHTALFDGLEWNVRLSSIDAAHVIDRVRMTFESHWASEHFEAYDPARQRRGAGAGAARASTVGRSARRRRSRSRTSTCGRTRISSGCSRRSRSSASATTVTAISSWRRRGQARRSWLRSTTEQLVDRAAADLSLLFVAHREEILRQSLATYRAVLRDGAFGEIHGGGRIAEGRHVFAMVQSLHEDATRADRPGHLRRPRCRRVPSRRGRDVRPAAQASTPARATRAHRDARAPRRTGRHRVVRPADRRRAAALGGDRPGLPGPVSVLRRRRRNRPEPTHMEARRLRPRRAQQPPVERRPSCLEASGGGRADRA